MAGLNRVMLIGHLGKDPEVRHTQSGSAITNFSVATSEQWKDQQGQQQERTEWHRIVVFGKMAEVCEKYLAKGRQVYIEGKLRTSSYEKDGQTHYATDIVAYSVQFLGKGDGENKAEDKQSYQKSGAGQKQGYGGAPQGQGYAPPFDDQDDIPF